MVVLGDFLAGRAEGTPVGVLSKGEGVEDCGYVTVVILALVLVFLCDVHHSIWMVTR